MFWLIHLFNSILFCGFCLFEGLRLFLKVHFQKKKDRS